MARQDRSYLDEALVRAAEKGHTPFVRGLILLDADIHTQCEAPLRVAALGGYMDTVAVLRANGGSLVDAIKYAKAAGEEMAVLNLTGYMEMERNRYIVFAKGRRDSLRPSTRHP
jgi:hypothetical protein